MAGHDSATAAVWTALRSIAWHGRVSLELCCSPTLIKQPFVPDNKMEWLWWQQVSVAIAEVTELLQQVEFTSKELQCLLFCW